jgi:hypothetical protein
MIAIEIIQEIWEGSVKESSGGDGFNYDIFDTL